MIRTKYPQKTREEMIGLKYSELTILEYKGTRNHTTRWLCLCSCGKIKEFDLTYLRDKRLKNKSCGHLLYRKGENSPRWTGHGDIGGHFWASIQHPAELRGAEFNVSIEYIWDLFLKQDRKCALSGIELSFPKTPEDRKYHNASLDRIDSSKTYEEGNVQWVDKHVNKCKNNYSDEDFIAMCKKVAEYNK